VNANSVQPGEVLPLVRSIEAEADPLDLFCRLADGGRRPDTLLLESADTTVRQGEKSLLVLRSAVRARCLGRDVEISALSPNGMSLLDTVRPHLERIGKVQRVDTSLHIRFPPPASGNEEQRLSAPSPLDALRLLTRAPRVLTDELVCAPLVAGVFAYDLLGSFETLPPPRGAGSEWPDFEFILPDQMIWMNHRQRIVSIVAQVYGGREARRSVQDGAEAIARTAKALGASGRSEVTQLPGAAVPQDVLVDLDDSEFAELVDSMKRHVFAGDVFQIVPSRCFSAACTDPIAAYRRLRSLNPSPYMFFVNGSAGVLFGASPETALKVEGRPLRVEIRPIAGTRQRGRQVDGSVDPDLDGRLEAELRLDEKELAEHMMLVDLARNDVARVSEPGTRAVDRLLGVDRYSHVMHLVSHVSGRLRADLDALHAYVATMNMGTLVGAPKLKAAELLRRYESGRRGPYGGAIGYFTADGRMDTSIVIRSAEVSGGVARVRAGAGVVADSDPRSEALETRRKAEAVLSALRSAT
jgi:anthranilate synthase component 1